MYWFRGHPIRNKSVSVLLLGAYLVACLGIIPSSRVILGWFGRLTSERYPCEQCGCGCASATECWTHCCCHTAHERLIWAISNGVMPPRVVEFSDEQWIAAANAVKPDSAHCVACVTRVKDELRRGIATRPVHGSSGTCDDAGGDGCGQSPAGTAAAGTAARGASCCAQPGDEKTSPFPGGRSISALSCKGLAQQITMALPPSLPFCIAAFTMPKSTSVAWHWRRHVAYDSRSLEVPAPPPRVSPRFVR